MARSRLNKEIPTTLAGLEKYRKQLFPEKFEINDLQPSAFSIERTRVQIDRWKKLIDVAKVAEGVQIKIRLGSWKRQLHELQTAQRRLMTLL